MSEHPHMDSREPLLRIAKRDALPLWKNWAIRLAAVVLALLVWRFRWKRLLFWAVWLLPTG